MDGLAASAKWKKGQLAKVRDNFKNPNETNDLIPSSTHKRVGVAVTTPDRIESDEEVQPMWQEMESRVLNRRSLTKEQARMKGKRSGRSNLRPTDEDAWLSAGLYDNKSE